MQYTGHRMMSLMVLLFNVMKTLIIFKSYFQEEINREWEKRIKVVTVDFCLNFISAASMEALNIS